MYRERYIGPLCFVLCYLRTHDKTNFYINEIFESNKIDIKKKYIYTYLKRDIYQIIFNARTSENILFPKYHFPAKINLVQLVGNGSFTRVSFHSLVSRLTIPRDRIPFFLLLSLPPTLFSPFPSIRNEDSEEKNSSLERYFPLNVDR